MKLVFMGTPPAAVPTLNACIESFDVAAVYTQPDRRRGRGRVLTSTPVGEIAERAGIPTHKPASLRKEPEAVEQLAEIAPDVIVVVAYGQILPQNVLDIPVHGCVNVHFSLLPRWRGAAPVERAIEAGDSETGVAIMRMDAGLDTGDVFAELRTPIGPETTTADLLPILAQLGAALTVETLPRIVSGELHATPQATDGITHATKIGPEDRLVDFTRPAAEIDRKIRALTGSATAYTTFRSKRLGLLGSRLADGTGKAGEVLAGDTVRIACGDGAVEVLQVVPEGKPPMDGNAFVNGYRPAGEIVG